MKDVSLTNELKTLSNSQLFDTAKKEVSEETNQTLRVLYVLKEIERRRAFAERSHSSLFEFCTEFLGYKRDAAYRRIAAMRALKELPEIEQKVRDGNLSLSTVAQMQTHFVQKKRANESLTREQKLKVVSSFENKSTREVEKLIVELIPQEAPKERVKPIDSENEMLQVTLPKRVLEKIQKMKMLMGPEKAGVETWEAIEEAFDIAIKQKEKFLSERAQTKEKKEQKTNERKGNQPDKRRTEKFRAPGKKLSDESDTNKPSASETHMLAPKLSRRASISIIAKRRLWTRSQGQCEYLNGSGLRCSSKFKLEADHIKPKAVGGNDDFENLRLVCRSHNQFAAIQQLGLNTMDRFIN